MSNCHLNSCVLPGDFTQLPDDRSIEQRPTMAIEQGNFDEVSKQELSLFQ